VSLQYVTNGRVRRKEGERERGEGWRGEIEEEGKAERKCIERDGECIKVNVWRPEDKGRRRKGR